MPQPGIFSRAGMRAGAEIVAEQPEAQRILRACTKPMPYGLGSMSMMLALFRIGAIDENGTTEFGKSLIL